MKTFFSVLCLATIGAVLSQNCAQIKQLSTSKLICYYGSDVEDLGCYCTHVILPANSDLKKLKERVGGAKVYVSVNEFNQGLIDLLKTHKIDGLELDLKKLDTKNDISDFISTIKTKLGNDLDVLLSVPPKADLLAKYFDFKALSKHVDLYILQTAFLGATSNVTFHPSRLSGLWDIQNTDSVVDLVSGLGAPLSKLVITAPVQAFQFKLQNEEYTAPGSPALELQTLTRNELCKLMQSNKNWTLERDEDQAGPYIFSKNRWIAFEDSKSIDIKVKYSKIRGLAGVALKDLTQDATECGSSILETTYNGLSRQARAPRGAVLHSLEREIVDTSGNPLNSVQLSPYKISRIIDTEGKIHVVRQDTRTEFQCSRQGYFVHPRSCNRFYRCVKFDQLSDDYNVFEFDCPSGLAFDERVEVCVWPGSLPHGTPCSGSSEIAPVPKQRFVCPSEPGYYADPENCRWFFACLDHGKSTTLSAYEFRCPYGLVFDGERLVCEWPWLVPKCANSFGVGLDSEYYYGNVKDQQSAGVILQNYNGLGQLGAVKLGGLSGKIQKPIATVYSNVIDGQGYGGLPYKASQALENAGLLRVNNGAGYRGSILINGQNQYDHLANSQGATNIYHQQLTANSGQFDQQHLVQGAVSHQNYEASEHQQNNAALSSHFNQLQIDAGKNINIIGGGYSIVGTPSNLDIPIDDNKSPVIISAPTVTSVPVPGIKTSSAFETVQGGVIANVPKYQYKIKSLEDAGLFANISSNFANFVVKSAANEATIRDQLSRGLSAALNPVTAKSFVSLINDHPQVYISSTVKPAIAAQNVYNIQQQHDAVFQKYNEGNEYQRQVVVESQHHQSTPRPSVIVQEQPIYKNNNAAIISKFSIRKPAKTVIEDYTYQKESVVPLYQQPQLLSTYTYQPPVQQQPITRYTYQSVAQNSAITPIHAYSYQPTGGSYQYVNVQNKQQQYSSNGGYIYTKSASQDSTANGGYVYEKPSVKFEETPSPSVAVQPAQVTSYFNVGTYQGNSGEAKNIDYSYPKPVVQYSTPRPVEVQQPAVVSSYFNVVNSHANSDEAQQAVGYTYSKPIDKFEEASVVYSTPKPAVVTSYFNGDSTKTDDVLQQNIGYTYAKPEVKFDEVAVVSSTPRPVQPAVVTNYYNIGSTKANSEATVEQQNIGYTYPRPEVKFEEAPVVYSTPKPLQPATIQIVDQQNIGYSYPRPQVKFEEVAVVSSTPKPVQSAVVTSYYNIGSSKANSDVTVEQQNIGYTYPRPEVKFEGAPVVYSTPKPVQPAIVSSYYNVGSTKAESDTVLQQNIGYSYPRPEVKFEETPVVYSTPKPIQPAVVTSYYNIGSSKANSDVAVEQQNIGYTYPRPQVKFEEVAVVSSTPKPVQPAVVTSYYNLGSTKADSNTVLQQQNVGYTYPRPEVKFEETPVVYATPKPVPPAVVTSYYNIGSSKANSEVTVEQKNIGYNYPRPEVKFEEAPVVYSTPKPVTHYYNLPSSTPQPHVALVNVGSTKADSETLVQHQNIGYSYPQPEVKFEETPVVYSTPKPVQPAVVTSYYNLGSSKANSEVNVEQQNIEYTYPQPEETPVEYSTPKPLYYPSSTPQPAVVTSYFNIGSTSIKPDTSYSYPQQEIEIKPRPSYIGSTTSQQPNLVVEEVPSKGYSYPEPVQEVPFVKKTAYVTGQYQQENYNQGKVVIENYEFPEYEKVKQVVFGAKTQQPTFASTIRTIIAKKKKLQPITPAVVTSYDSRLTSTPAYVSSTVTTRPKYVVKSTTVEPVRTYLPVTSTVEYTSALPKRTKVVEEYVAKEYLPSRQYLPTREYLPANKVTTEEPEITTLSREYLPVRTRLRISTTTGPPSRIKVSRPVTVIKQNDAHPLLSAKLGAQCTCVSNTLKLRKKQKIIVVEEDDDDGYVVDNNVVEKIVVTSTLEPQVYVKKNNSLDDNSSPSDREIAKAVRTGLKLVKQAAKEGTQEALSKHQFDRYGPGGLRSKSETLQGTIDCQRAGLFRHPSQCNKFYACRWDCTKNRFTLHVFNCPVHLTFDNSLGACNWPSQGPACVENTLITSD